MNILITIRKLLNPAELIRAPTGRVSATPEPEEDGGAHFVRQNIPALLTDRSVVREESFTEMIFQYKENISDVK